MLNDAVREKVVIAGAGPAGLSAAIVLAKSGHAVEVHEAKPQVGARWKRGLQIIENFSERSDVLETFRGFGIQTNFSARPVRSVSLVDAAGRRSAFESKEPLGYYVSRGAKPGELDHSLLEQARAAGAQVTFNSRLPAGAGARIFAAGPRRIDGLGKEVTFKTPLSDRMTVILDPKLAPGGYAYLFVVQGDATLGFAAVGDYKSVEGRYAETVERFRRLDGVQIEGGDVSYSYANFFMNRSLDRRGTLLAGEAGGFQDYLFGFGIRFAVTSGVLAARSIAEGVSYDALWKASLGPKARAGFLNRFMYESFRSWLPPLFIGLARRHPDFREYMRGWYADHPLKAPGAWVARRLWSSRHIYFEETSPHEPVELDHR